MTKFQLMLTSLVAVIPGAFLVLLLVMALLSYSENLSTIAYVVIGGTLLATSIVVLIPAGIFVGGRRKPVKPKTALVKETGDEIQAIDEDVAVVDELDGLSGEDDVVMGTSEFEIADDDAEMSFEDDLDTEPVEEADSFEIDEDDFDIDDEPKPKKKKH